MTLRPLLVALAVLVLSGEAGAAPGKAPPPSDAACAMGALPKGSTAFGPGESLEFDLDALGAKAGTLTLRTLVSTGGALPVQALAQTNTFFSKVRRVKGSAISYLNPRTFKPSRYVEDATENEVHRNTEALFIDSIHRVRAMYRQGTAPQTQRDFPTNIGALDNVGAVYFMRQLPLQKDLKLCFDVFALRRLWRLSGKVIAREHVSLPVGEFDAWHLQGEAVRLDDYGQRREIHLWISDDARRLPLVAVGSIDLGAVRATLTSFHRPMDKNSPRPSAKRPDSAL